MIHISGHDRSQMFLLPESVDDYVGADNPVRFIEAFVDELDLAGRGSSTSRRRRRAAPAMRQPNS
jgi:transposase